MNCPRKIALLALALGLAWSLDGSPQTAPPSRQEQPPPAQRDQRERIRVPAELVVVPVTVKDAQGVLVVDLHVGDFRIFEDGVEQKITLFSVDPAPLSAVVLIDNALRLKTAEQVAGSLRAIAGGFSDADEVAILRFDVQQETLGDFTSDNDKLLTQLKRLDLDKTFPGAGSGPMTSGPRVNTAPPPGPPSKATIRLGSPGDKNINDALYAAAELLRDRARDRRKVIFLISDGHNSKNNTYSFDDALKQVLSAGISVYAVGVGDANLDLVRSVLARYARATGGDIVYGDKRAELERLYARVAEQARNQYTLGYSPQGTDRSLDFHSIEVRVRRPALTILARDGYYPAGQP